MTRETWAQAFTVAAFLLGVLTGLFLAAILNTGVPIQ